MKKIFLASLTSMKKGVGSGVGSGSGSISQRYGSGDPDPHQNVTSHGFPTLDLRNAEKIHSLYMKRYCTLGRA
jgi:hypothetical protein